MTLIDSLSNIFKFRINRNDDIRGYMKQLDRMGKIDQPKTVAVMTELLVRLAALEDEIEAMNDMHAMVTRKMTSGDVEGGSIVIDKTETPALSWVEVRHKAKELGVFKPGLKREELEALIASKK